MSDANASAERLRLGPLHNPVRGLLHGSAALFAVGAAMHFAWSAGCQGPLRVALLVSALSQVGLFAASSLYHSAPCPSAGRSACGASTTP